MDYDEYFEFPDFYPFMIPLLNLPENILHLKPDVHKLLRAKAKANEHWPFTDESQTLLKEDCFGGIIVTSTVIEYLIAKIKNEARRKEVMLPLLKRAHASMAITANYKLVSLFLEVFDLNEIMEACLTDYTRRHMYYLLQLNPKVDTLNDVVYVSKHKAPFREWLMEGLKTLHREAKKKLIWYYYDNMATWQYKEKELLVGGHIFGLGYVPYKSNERLTGQLGMRKGQASNAKAAAGMKRSEPDD